MRKYLYLAVAAAAATALAAPAVAEAQPPPVNVLMTNQGSPAAVQPGDTLSASLASGTSALFKDGNLTITCASSSLTFTVSTNPLAPGTATESQTAETIADCKVNALGASISSVTLLNLPYNASVSDAAGFPVLITPQNGSSPIELSAIGEGFSTSGPITCNYEASSLAGSFSNTDGTITFANQMWTFVSGDPLHCAPSLRFSATYGPVRDTSVSGNPVVSVN